MKKVLLIVGVLAVGLLMVTHKKSKTQTQVQPVYLPEEDVQPRPQKTFQNQVASFREIQGKLKAVSQKPSANLIAPSKNLAKKREMPNANPVPVSRPQQTRTAQNAPTSQGRAPIHKLYDPADLELLKRASIKAREDGSRIAYVGEVQDLYAFSPNFFETYRDQDGQQALRVRQVHSYDKVRSPSGVDKMLVQREPYPVPSSKNYDLVSRAIMKAIDDGATVVNIASSSVDRNRLNDAIQYARTRGVPVITVPPPQN